jgi:iron complex outermembrane recepter protein
MTARSVLFLLLLSLVCISPVAAQDRLTEVRGTVTSRDGAPVPQASVLLVGSDRGTLTDEKGIFRLRGVPSGGQRIRVTAMGYAPAVREVFVATGTSAELVIEMVPTPLTLSGVDVTATPTGRDPMSIAQATSQLSGRELERALGGTLGQTLEGQPGLSIRYNGPAASMPVLRGLSGDRILLLQDGQRAGDLAGSADDHSVTIDPLAARRLEVVRGPASLLYGTNALGGVINVISADLPTEVPARSLWTTSVQTESAFPGLSGGLRGEVPLAERWAMTVRGGARSAGDARIGADPLLGDRLENTFHRNLHGAAGLGYTGTSVYGGMVLQGYGMQHGVPLPPGEEQPVLEGRKLSATGRLTVQTGSAAFPAVRLQAAATDYSHEELEDGEVEMAFALRTLTSDLLLRQARRGVLGDGAWGVSVLARDYVATGEEQLTAPADSRSMGVFTYQELLLGGTGAALQLGGRADRYSIESHPDPNFGPGTGRSFTAFSGSAGLSIPLVEGVTAGLSAARSFRAPTVEELFSNALHIGTASFEIGDPQLAPEYAQGLEAVLRMRRMNATGEVSLYSNEISGFIHFQERGDTVLDGTTWPVLAYVQDRALFRGVEASAEVVLHGSLVAGVRGDIVRAKLADGTPVPFMPPARVAGSLRWEGAELSAGGGVRHAFAHDRVGMADELPTNAYTLLDLHAGFRRIFGGSLHSVQLRLDNLTDALYRDSSSRVKSFAPNPGRNISLLYRVHF